MVLCGGYNENLLLRQDCFIWRPGTRQFEQLTNDIPYKTSTFSLMDNSVMQRLRDPADEEKHREKGIEKE